MKIVKVEAGGSGYEVRIGVDLLPRTGSWLKEKGLSGKAVVVTDSNVEDLYSGTLKEGLESAGFAVTVLVVPAGEEYKSLESAGRLYHELTDSLAERTTPVLALGGGVIGDLAGFVAATYMRGIPLIQVPTTLLAQVDSSIGGKVAVDHDRLKNTIGVFYQPRLVISDTGTLKTLPEEEIANGMAEVIKSAAIGDRGFFDYLEERLGAGTLDGPAFEEIVLRTAGIKVGVVEKDEKEQGLRAILNYGHTIGHALETVSGFRLKHGRAVAIGMAAAAAISSRMGILGESEVSRLKAVIEKAGLPVRAEKLDIEEVMRAMRHDKKVKSDKVRFVLLRTIGEAFITDGVNPSLVEEVLRGD